MGLYQENRILWTKLSTINILLSIARQKLVYSSKAFNVVNINLLEKMPSYGLHGFLNLDQPFPYRKKIVKTKNFHSALYNVISGMSQGKHLGPLLFSIFINYLVLSIKNSEIIKNCGTYSFIMWPRCFPTFLYSK